MSYANVTINDSNIIKRRLQKKRYEHALIRLGAIPVSFAGNILDFGGGNGELCKYIYERFPLSRITLYEPAPQIREEASHNLSDYPKIEITGNLCDIPSSRFDLIFCLSVFEHIPEDQYGVLLKEFNRLLGRDGLLVVGIPIEIYSAALFKGIFRMLRRYGAYDANLKNILKCFVGKPPKDRPISLLGNSLPYHFDHTGFDYRIFQSELVNNFKVIKTYGSPLPFLFTALNFEKYYLCKKIST